LDEEVRRIMAAHLPIYMLDEVRLAALAPDVVVTQAACEVCAIAHDQVVASLRLTAPGARVVSLQPSRLADILRDVETVAHACGVGAHGRTVAASLRARLDRVAAAGTAFRPRVAVVEWLAPPMLAGHWVPDAIEAAGGMAVGPAAGTPSPCATWEEIGSLALDALVVAPCGFDLPRTVREAVPVADALRGLAPRVLLMDGNAYLNRPGPRIVDAVETIAGWLRGEPVPEDRAAPLARAVTSAAPSTA
jgi:iron complex transport system substrate-binding protein